MAKQVRKASAVAAESQMVAPGSVRACAAYRGELARHRVITADGMDYVVVTADQRRQGRGHVTTAYPVVRGYLVMMRQPLCELVCVEDEAAREQHALLVRVLAEAGTGVVRARRRSAAWRRAERTVGADEVHTGNGIELRDLVGSMTSGEGGRRQS